MGPHSMLRVTSLLWSKGYDHIGATSRCADVKGHPQSLFPCVLSNFLYLCLGLYPLCGVGPVPLWIPAMKGDVRLCLVWTHGSLMSKCEN